MLMTVFTLIVLLFSIILHEIAHGTMALSLGDDTAQKAGRLTINPINHLDPIGSVLLPLFLFFITSGNGPIIGWAKPVPVNPYNFKDKKWGNLKVALAGPMANFATAILFGSIMRFFNLNFSLLNFLSIIVIYNLFLGLFNLVPIPPLDGSHILFSLLPKNTAKLKVFLIRNRLLLLLLFISFGLDILFALVVILYSLLVG